MKWISDFPTRWPTQWRRAFVVLFPVAIPLWLGAWALVVVAFFCMGCAFILFWVASLPAALLRAVWLGRKIEDAFTVVTDMWEAIFRAVTKPFRK